jgi:hypothetical protein
MRALHSLSVAVAILAASATLAAAQSMGPTSVPNATGAPAPAPGGAVGPGMTGPLTPGESVTPGQGAEVRTVFKNPDPAPSADITALSREDAETMHACTAMPNAVMMTNPGCVAFMRDHPDIRPKS